MVGAVVTALEQLIDRAQDVSELSMRGIAERAGVGIGSVYDYFTGQEALFGEFVARLTQTNFDTAQQVVEETHALPLHEALAHILDHAVATFLERPRRTRAAVALIARLGQVEHVVRERDRFARLVAARIARERPAFDRERLEATVRVVLDAGMGVILAELWRPTADVRQALRDLADAAFARAFGEALLTPGAGRPKSKRRSG